MVMGETEKNLVTHNLEYSGWKIAPQCFRNFKKMKDKNDYGMMMEGSGSVFSFSNLKGYDLIFTCELYFILIYWKFINQLFE